MKQTSLPTSTSMLLMDFSWPSHQMPKSCQYSGCWNRVRNLLNCMHTDIQVGIFNKSISRFRVPTQDLICKALCQARRFRDSSGSKRPHDIFLLHFSFSSTTMGPLVRMISEIKFSSWWTWSSTPQLQCLTRVNGHTRGPYTYFAQLRFQLPECYR